ncbi:MAG: lipid-binding SYLF domain-containing protein [Pyrinomonadaceae bacterium]
MKQLIQTRIFWGVAMLISFVVIPAAAQKSVIHARNEAREATQLLTGVMSVPAKSIPRSILRRAQAIAVFTNVKKGGFIIGGTGGDGVISRRTGNTWGPPVFYDISGADIGLQIGAKKSDFILVFMTESAFNDLLDDDLELTAGIGAAAGPVGETAAVTTGTDSNVYVYSHSSGAFAGATIGGASIKANNSINQELYKMRGGDVLTDSSKIKMSTLPAELRTFSTTLAQYSK